MTVNESLYLIYILTEVNNIFSFIGPLTGILSTFTLILYIFDDNIKERKFKIKYFIIFLLISVFSGIITFLIPDEKNMYIMVANTYIGSEIPIKAKQVIIKKLDGYLNESK